MSSVPKSRRQPHNFETPKKLKAIRKRVQEQLIVRLCNQLSQDEGIDAELKRIRALKAEVYDNDRTD